jgi:hypothetical protein
MRRWVIVLVAVAAALVAPSSLAQVVLAPALFHSQALRANAITSFAVTCSPGYVATSAGISSPALGVTLLSVRPAGLRAYGFRFGNPATNGDQKVTVVVSCRKLSSSAGKPGPTLKQQPVRFTAKVLPGKSSAVEFVCPSRTVPAGIGFDRSPSERSRAYNPGAAARISVRKASMHLGGFSFVVFNGSASVQKVTLYGNCLTVLRPAGARPERLAIKITTFRDLAGPGTQQFTHVCPKGWVSLAAGYAVRSAQHTVQGAAAIMTGGRWSVESDAQTASIVDLQLVCAVLRR